MIYNDTLWLTQWIPVGSKSRNWPFDTEIFQYQGVKYPFFSRQRLYIVHFITLYVPSCIIREVLQNPYAPLSNESWNQTLRKAKLFHQSWARRKIRTKYGSHFEDQITGNTEYWAENEDLSMQNVVTLKLYTDFDTLQWAMKQCFRLEMMDNIDANGDEDATASEQNQKAREELETRIAVFFHWRAALMIVLNKFGTRWSDMEDVEALYTGINQKMELSSTAAFSFYGPLSTSSNYYVAKGFATEKGMVLKIASRFPRLNYCTAFQASLLSDYPEEEEWLIGHMC